MEVINSFDTTFEQNSGKVSNEVLKEIIPITPYDCFTINKRIKSEFDFPLHYHEEFELNYISHAKGARRVIGDHVSEIDDLELVLVGSNLRHAWFNHNCTSERIVEVTIQFQKDFFEEKFLKRNQMFFLKSMLDQSSKGILFSKHTTLSLSKRIETLSNLTGFDSVLELMSILHDLSISRNYQTLSNSTFGTNGESYTYNSRRVEKALDYMNNNFGNQIGLGDVAKMANMSEVAFSRFFKQKTGTNFIDTLTDIRLGQAARMLIDTTHSITEIAYTCGFNNISNFNRIFKKKKGCTPKDFRTDYLVTKSRTFI